MTRISATYRPTSRALLETKQLLVFKTIVEVGGFTRAGQRLNLSQSAISQHVRALEKEVGVPLLLRQGKAIRLTPAGEVLLRYATQVLEKIEEAQWALAEQGERRAAVVRLGTPEPACSYLVPPLLVEVKRRLPKVDLRVASGHTGATLAQLIAGEIDLGLLPLPVEPQRMRITELGRDELVGIVRPDHAWAARQRVEARDFAAEHVVLYDRQSQITDLTLGFLLAEGVFPRVAAEIAHLEGVKQMVALGLGVAVVPAWSVRRELAARVLAAVGLGRTGLVRSWGLIYADTRPLPATFRSLLRLCGEVLPPLLSPAA